MAAASAGGGEGDGGGLYGGDDDGGLYGGEGDDGGLYGGDDGGLYDGGLYDGGLYDGGLYDGDDGGPGFSADARVSIGPGGPTPELLELRERLSAYEAEVRALRSQVQAQRQLLDLLQADALEGAAPRGSTAAEQDVPLLVAADRGDAAMVRLLLEGGAEGAGHGDAALLLAAQGGHVDVARVLLDRGAANVHADLDSPLLWAAKRGDAEMASLLLAHGADPSALRACAMRLAIAGGHAEVVRALAAARRARGAG